MHHLIWTTKNRKIEQQTTDDCTKQKAMVVLTGKIGFPDYQ